MNRTLRISLGVDNQRRLHDLRPLTLCGGPPPAPKPVFVLPPPAPVPVAW